MTERTQQSISDEQERQMLAAFPLGRLGHPQDVAAATLFLLSSASSWITGVTLDVAAAASCHEGEGHRHEGDDRRTPTGRVSGLFTPLIALRLR
jgi:hypothetical protein